MDKLSGSSSGSGMSHVHQTAPNRVEIPAPASNSARSEHELRQASSSSEREAPRAVFQIPSPPRSLSAITPNSMSFAGEGSWHELHRGPGSNVSERTSPRPRVEDTHSEDERATQRRQPPPNCKGDNDLLGKWGAPDDSDDEGLGGGSVAEVNSSIRGNALMRLQKLQTAT